jgi:hypothetical protein
MDKAIGNSIQLTHSFLHMNTNTALLQFLLFSIGFSLLHFCICGYNTSLFAELSGGTELHTDPSRRYLAQERKDRKIPRAHKKKIGKFGSGPRINIPDPQHCNFSFENQTMPTRNLFRSSRRISKFLFLFWTSFALHPGQENCQK